MRHPAPASPDDMAEPLSTLSSTASPAGPERGHRRRRTGPAGRAVSAAVALAVLGITAGRVMAAPVGPIAVSGSDQPAGMTAAHVSFGLDVQGRVARVTVERPAAVGAPDEDATVVVRDGSGAVLARATARLRGPATVVELPAPVAAAAVAGVGLRRA